MCLYIQYENLNFIHNRYILKKGNAHINTKIQILEQYLAMLESGPNGDTERLEGDEANESMTFKKA